MRKMLQRPLAFLMALAVVLTTNFTLAFAADNAAVFLSVDTEEVETGEVLFTADIRNNPGIAGFTLKWTVSGTAGDVTSLFTPGNAKMTGILTEGSIYTDASILWFNSTNVNGDGSLFTFPLTISQQVPAGSYTLSLSLADDSAKNFVWRFVKGETDYNQLKKDNEHAE